MTEQRRGITLRDVSVGDILKIIGQKQVFNIGPKSTVHQASFLMETHNVGALVVLDAGKLVGIISERDVLRRCVVPLKDPKTTTVADIMTPDPQTVTLKTLSTDCEDWMKELNARHLPVMDGEEVVGVVSMKDILVVTRQDQQFLADQLHGYVTGG